MAVLLLPCSLLLDGVAKGEGLKGGRVEVGRGETEWGRERERVGQNVADQRSVRVRERERE